MKESLSLSTIQSNEDVHDVAYQIRFPKTVKAMARVNELSGSLHAVLHPRTHKFGSSISVQIRSHTVAKILLPRALVNVVVRVKINTEAVFRVAFPLSYGLST